MVVLVKWLVGAGLLGVSAVLFSRNRELDRAIYTPQARPANVVELQRARTASLVESLFEKWEVRGRPEVLRKALHQDFAFIVAYGAFMSYTLWWVARSWFWLGPSVALADVLENLLCLALVKQYLGTGVRAPIPPLMSFSASLKMVGFAFFFVVIVGAWFGGAR